MTQNESRDADLWNILVTDIRSGPCERARQPGRATQGAIPAGAVAMTEPDWRWGLGKEPRQRTAQRERTPFYRDPVPTRSVALSGCLRIGGCAVANQSSVISVVDNAPDPDHHLWRNGRLWWIAFTVHRGHLQERVRFSLGTDDVVLARRRRDETFAIYAAAADCNISIRLRPRRGRERRPKRPRRGSARTADRTALSGGIEHERSSAGEANAR
jgi:hypothetical protein